MKNAADLRNDVNYQYLFQKWVQKFHGRARISDARRIFAAVNDRGRTDRLQWGMLS